MRLGRSGPDDLLNAGAFVPSDEAPKGYRLRRVGPGEWIAEPSRSWLYIVIAAVAAFALGGVAGAFAARRYYHTSATPMVVIVNGAPLRRDELRARCEGRYGIQMVNRFVADELARQFAVSKDCWPTDAEVEALHERERAKPDYHERLALSDQTEEEYVARLRRELSEAKLLCKGVSVTDAEIRTFYETNIDPANPGAKFHTRARVQVSAIAAASAQSARDAQAELADGVPWNTVVARVSLDPSREIGGRLLPFSRGESVFATDPVIENAVFAMTPGERLGPVRAAGKWWIIRCDTKWRASTIPWADARDDARMGALIGKGIRRNRSKIEAERLAFVRRSTIRIYDDGYSEAAEPDLSLPLRW